MLTVSFGAAPIFASSGGLQFDGVNDYVTFGKASGLGTATFTLECWFKRTATGATTSTGSGGVTAFPLVTRGRGEADGSNVDMNWFLGIRSSDNVLAADFEEGATGSTPGLNHPVAGVTPIANNQWYHAAVTYDGTKWQLFLNGALETELAVGQPPRADSIQHAALGSALTSTGAAQGYFAGVLDEVRVWNYARSASQIAGSMNQAIESAAGLIGRWSLDETSGTTATDSAGSGINGTLMNGPVWVTGYPLLSPPSVSLTSPADGATFLAPVDIILEATAPDSDGTVAKVEFFQAGTKLGEDISSPFSYNWSGVSPGQYTLTAVATDNGGLTATSAPVHITVNDPTVRITSPAHGAQFVTPTDVSITAESADPNITLVEFFQGTTKLGEASASPYTCVWTDVPAGSYSLTAVATSSGGGKNTSAQVLVTVVPNTPPTVAIASPPPDSSFTLPTTVTIEATAADSDGALVLVEFYAGDTKIGEDTIAPYACTWSGMAVGYYSLTAVATDNGGLSATSAPVTISINNLIRLVSTGAIWSYLDDGSDQGVGWRASYYDDSAWASGPAQLGYGDGDEATVVSYGPDANKKYVTTYFRREFTVTDAEAYNSLTLRLLRDDGAVVYLNGVEVARQNMPAGTVAYNTYASSAIGEPEEDTFYETAVNPALLVEGENLLAVEVHQGNATSTDLSFDLELSGTKQIITVSQNAPANGAVDVNRPPTLSATVSHRSGQPLTVTYYGRVAPPPAGPDFTLVVLPDTQNYTAGINGGTLAMFLAQADWIATNRAASNFVFAAQLGDCSQNGDTAPAEWRNATNALYRLENPLTTLLAEGLPYGLAVGNHDQYPARDPNGTTTNFNLYFGETHFGSRGYYGGHYGANNDNHYELFSASGLNFIIVFMEFMDDSANPRTEVLNWANSLLQNNPSRRAIVVCHSILNVASPATWTAQGQATYDALKGNPNLFLLLCGHNSGEARREDFYINHTVYSLLSDYQGRTGGGNGWLRFMQFSPANNLIRVRTYSPYLKQFETDADSQFDLPYEMEAGGEPFAVLGTYQNVPSDSTVEVAWPGLAVSTTYEWYVSASDGTETVNSPRRKFTTGANLPPIVSLTAPAPGASYVAPADITIQANATDSDGNVTEVEFFQNGNLLFEDTAAPFEVTWSAVPQGNYALTAVAYDNEGGMTTSATVNITVNEPNNIPPTVSIASPMAGSTFEAPATVTITADATDSDGSITLVEFFAGANKQGDDATAPYEFAWNNIAAGSYTLTAVAYDNRGASTISAGVAITVQPPPALVRGPYLQLGTPDGVILRWRTDVATGSRVRYGTTPDALTTEVTDPAVTPEHAVTLAGLLPGTRYHYEIGTPNGWFARADSEFFDTAPVAGSAQPTRIWVLGDSGAADANAAAVRNGYLTYASSQRANLWLMLGDNAYLNGTDREYQAALFDLYPTLLPNTVLWPALGDFDTARSASPPADLPYFGIFNLPGNAEAGGTASGTEKYYSFNHANIHFVCLDSMSSDRTVSGIMLAWLQNDLATNTQPWVVAYWHHPPYSKGSHNSDTETESMQMRGNALSILESEGVDLVLSAHSRSYERSFLINGHYGNSDAFLQSMKVDGGDGRMDGTGAYQKPPGILGTVYVVTGSGSEIAGGALNHPAMFTAANALGSLVLDVNNDRMDVAFVGTDGIALDHFTILKPAVPTAPPIAPSGLTTTPVSSSEIDLHWTDNADNETGFKVERSLDGVSFIEVATLGANFTSIRDSGLTPDTAYYYQVRASNAAGDSGYSTPSSATTLPLPAPTGLTAVAGDGTVTLTWDEVPGASQYYVKRSTTSGGPYDTKAYGSETTYTDSGLANGTTYYYVVAAGQGPNSAEVSATPMPQPPAPPTNLQVMWWTGSEIELTWTDNSSDELGFKITRSTDGVNYALIGTEGPGSTFFADAGLEACTLYYYRIQAYNEAGNSAPAEISQITLDETPPVITCAPNQTVAADANCQAAIPDLRAQVSASDTCSGVTVTQVPAAYTVVGLGTAVVTLTATDAAGNYATCQTTFTVQDTSPPVITGCPADTGPVPMEAGTCGAVVTWTAPTATDNCTGAVAVNCSPASGSVFNKGTTVVTCTASDVSGNTATCSFNVVVTDTQGPTITCPADVVVGAAAGTCAATGVALGTPVTADNCGVASVGNDAPASFPVGVTTVTWTVTDTSGNMAQCSQTVTVTDNEAPVIAGCPANIGPAPMEAGACGAVVTWTAPTVIDNCARATIAQTAGPTSGSLFPAGTTTVTYTATDAARNTAVCSFTVTVNADAEAPVVTLNGVNPMTIECHSSFTDPGASANDACAGNLPVTASGTVDVNTPGAYTLTYSATDPSGNPATAIRTVNVVDTTAPGIIILGNNPATVECYSGYTDAGATASDSCAGVLNPTSTSTVDVNTVGGYTVTYSVTDPSGNTATATRTVNVVDTTPPSISAVTAGDITETSARITWTTGEPADSVVDYGLDTNYGIRVNDNNAVTAHVIDLVNLTPGTTYHYQVTSHAAAGNSSSVGDFVFATSAQTAYDAFASQDPTVTYGTLGGEGYAATFANDGTVQTITEAGSSARLQAEYLLQSSASPAEVNSLTLYLEAVWTALEPSDPLVVAIWNGSAWETVTADIQDGTFSPAANPQNYVDVEGNIRVRFTDTVARRGEKKDTLSIDLLYAHLTTGPRPNQNPVAAADTGTTQVDTPVTVAVLANDSDPDSDPLTIAQVSSPTSGTAILNADQTITYTPEVGFTGTDAFTYTISDGRGGTAVGTVTVTVNSSQNTVHVENIAMVLLSSGKNWKAQATVLIHDQSAQPKAGAVIYGDWYFKGNLTQTGVYATADATGQAVLVSPPAKAVAGDTFTFVVTNIMLTGYGYDPGQNTETQDSITMQ